MKDAVLYIHGKGGSAAESKHYKALFPEHEMIGPWETGAEIHTAVEKLKAKYESILLIANSIGAFFQYERRNRPSAPQGLFHFSHRRYGEADY